MNQLHAAGRAGVRYFVDILKPDGRVEQEEEITNLIPVDGLTYIVNAALKGGAQFADWFISLYEGNYTPGPTTNAADYPTAATECTAHTPANRLPIVWGATVAGSTDNSANRAEFTFTADKTIYGGVIHSSQPFGSTSGVIPSAMRFASPKTPKAGDVLRVRAVFTLASAA